VGQPSTVFEGHGGIESIGQPSYLPLAYNPVAKTRIPGVPVTCERICGST
jgi:hypothetical protein